MNRARKILLHAVLLLLTIGYAGLVDLAFAGFRQFLSHESLTALPIPTLWLSMYPLPWQLLAFASLLLNCAWAWRGERKNADGRGYLYAAVLHLSWLLLCLVAHLLGMLLPFVARTYVIR
ncbi:MAG: hypothetical protein MUF02_10195 [Acidobacteria bacterium]|jgi:hypothetical protein|nr:hypothetical protein [Acidobacteriota bacterium]